MKIFTQLLVAISIFTIFNSCKKDDILLNTSGEFIEANVGNQFVRYESTNGNVFNNTYYNDTIFGISDTIIQDQLNLIRYAENGDKSFDIFILGRKLKRDDVPINLANVELQWRDYTQDVQVVFGQDDNVNYTGRVDLVIEEWDENNFLAGSFFGDIGTKTGDELSVENGKFRIQIFD